MRSLRRVHLNFRYEILKNYTVIYFLLQEIFNNSYFISLTDEYQFCKREFLLIYDENNRWLRLQIWSVQYQLFFIQFFLQSFIFYIVVFEYWDIIIRGIEAILYNRPHRKAWILWHSNFTKKFEWNCIYSSFLQNIHTQ